MRRSIHLILAATLTLAVVPGAAGAQPTVSDVEVACPDGSVPPADFWDVTGIHADSIACISWWQITQGNTLTTYGPAADIQRGQMARFLANLLTGLDVDLPAAGQVTFDDVQGTSHQQAIERLAAAEIVSGRDADTYAPGAPVRRDQMATFLVRAVEYALDQDLPAQGMPFTDVTGGTHATSIAKVATAGITGGTSPDTYSPTRTVNRAQMATFIARTAALLVEALDAELPVAADARLSGVGDDVIRGRIPGDAPALAVLSHRGSANFIVWTRDADNERIDLLVNTIGDYTGTRTANLASARGAVRSFDITADGTWSLRLLPLDSARQLGSSGGSGSGDDLVDASALAGTDVRLSHTGDANFIVWAYDGRGDRLDLLVNTIGGNDGVYILPNDTRYLDIRASGDWSVNPN